MADEGLKPRYNNFREGSMEGYISDDSEQSDGTLSHKPCPASTKPPNLTNKNQDHYHHQNPEPSKNNPSKQNSQNDTTQSHDANPATPTKYLFNQKRIQVTDPHLAGVLNDMISNPQAYKNIPMIDGIPAFCFTPLYPSSNSSSSSSTKTKSVPNNRKKRKMMVIQDPLGTRKSPASIDTGMKINKSSTASKDKKVATNRGEEVEMKGGEKVTPTPTPIPKPLTPTPTPRNKKGTGSRYAPTTSTSKTPTHEFSVMGTMMHLPVLSTNAPGERNTKMCPPCARLKIGGHVCTGAIPICDQCLERNLDAEMCCSEELLSVIRRRRRGEGRGVDKKGGGSGGVGGGKTVCLFGEKD